MKTTKLKKEPEVIVFEEPTSRAPKRGKEAARERKRFLSGDVSEVFAPVQDSNRDHLQQSQKSEDLDLKATLREVQSLAVTSYSVKDRRKFEEEQMKFFGAKAPKSEYVPYPHYQRVVKAKREKEKRVAEELRLRQMPTRKDKTRKSIKGKGRWKDNLRSLEPPIGKFKGGILKLSQKDITKVTGKSRTKK